MPGGDGVEVGKGEPEPWGLWSPPHPPSTLPTRDLPQAGLWYPRCLTGPDTEQCWGSECNKLRSEHMKRRELGPLRKSCVGAQRTLEALGVLQAWACFFSFPATGFLSPPFPPVQVSVCIPPPQLHLYPPPTADLPPPPQPGHRSGHVESAFSPCMLWKEVRLGLAGRDGVVGSVRRKRPLPSEQIQNPPFSMGVRGQSQVFGPRSFNSLFNK